MKIDLTREEWESLKYYLEDYFNMCRGTKAFRDHPNYFNKVYLFLEKLGSEWVDDDKQN